MKANQHEHCLIILMFRKSWLILCPFPAPLRCRAVSQGPPCLLLPRAVPELLCRGAEQNLAALHPSEIPVQPAERQGSFESHSGPCPLP